MPYGGTTPAEDKKIDRCVEEMMRDGTDKDKAIPICKAQVIKARKKIDAQRLNRKLMLGRAKAAQLEPELVQIYERELAAEARAIARRFSQLATSIVAAGPQWLPPPGDGVLRGTDKAVRKRVRPIHERILQEAIAEAALGIAFDVTAPLAQVLLDQLALRAEAIEEGLRQPVVAVIERSFTEGASIPETARAIREVVTAVTPWQAVMLARTDMISLANGGSQLAVRLVNEASRAAGEETFETKTWLATMDHRTRETHAQANGQEVPIDQPFSVGGQSLDYPGDPSGSDAEVINCRCTAIYSSSPTATTAASSLPLGGTMGLYSVSDGTTNLAGALQVSITEVEMEDEVEDEQPLKWQATLAFEGMPTVDGRYFPPDSLSWRELPLTLLAQLETQAGHDGAEVCGRIERIWREEHGEDTNAIMAEGVFDGDEFGRKVARLVGEQTLHGLSVDVAVGRTGLRNPETGEIVESEEIDLFDLIFGTGDFQTVLFDGVIGAATVCAFPAFDDATIAVVASGVYGIVRVQTAIMLLEKGLTAAAAGIAPLHPPSAWFEQPQLTGPTPLTVGEDGRVFGHVATWGVCHIGNLNSCTTAPRSYADYSFFHLGELTTEEGENISVGKITLDTGHAGLSAGRKATLRHYDDTGTAVADVRAGEDEYGIWFAGAVRPDVPETTVRKLRAAAISGDWRRIDGHLELVAALAVNVPGFPIPRTEVAVAASGQPEARFALVAAGIVTEEELEAIRHLDDYNKNRASASMSQEEMRTRLEALGEFVGLG